MRNFHRFRDSLWLMVLVALAIRLVAVTFLYKEQLDASNDHFSFGFETGRIARSIALGHGYGNPLFGQTGPTALITPVYPYLLASVFKLFGVYTSASALAILSLNSLFSALTCLPVYFMARTSFGSGVAAWAGWTWAVYPYAIQISAQWIWGKTLVCLLFTILVALTLQLGRSARIWSWVGYGLLWGLAAMTDPVVVSVLPFLGAWACYRLHRRGKSWVAPAMAGGLAFLVVVAPWTIRNHRTFHRFIPFRDGFWLEFRVGNTGDTSDEWTAWAHPSRSSSEMEELRRVGELAYMAEKRRQSLDFVSGHPGQFALLTFRRFAKFWTELWVAEPHYLATEPFEAANIIFCAACSLLAFWGLWLGFRQGRETILPFALVLLLFPLVYYITPPNRRHRHPMDPEIAALAAYAVANASSSRKNPA